MPRKESKEVSRANKPSPPRLAGDVLEGDRRVDRPANAEELSAETLLPEVLTSGLESSRADSAGDARQARIAQRAYEIAEARGFGAGAELDDWLQAEREIDAQYGAQQPPEDQFTG